MSDQEETEGTPEGQPESSSPDPTPEEIAAWREAYENKELMQADYTRKTQSAAEMRREADAKLAAAQEIMDRLGKPQDTGPPVNPALNDYAPELGTELGEIRGTITKLERMISEDRSRADKMLEAEQAEAKLENALSSVGSKPFANKVAIRAFLEENDLGPQHAEYAYQVTTAEKRAAAAAEAALKKRNAAAPAPMKKGSAGIQGSTPQEVAPSSSTPISKKSFRDITREMLNDPRMPGRS